MSKTVSADYVRSAVTRVIKDYVTSEASPGFISDALLRDVSPADVRGVAIFQNDEAFFAVLEGHDQRLMPATTIRVESEDIFSFQQRVPADARWVVLSDWYDG